MTRSGAIAALTVAAVLAATGTAAALNARILDPSPFRSVGTSDPVESSESPSASVTPSDLGSPTGVGLTPTPDDSDGPEEPATASASSDRTTARPASSSRTTSRPSSARPSSSKPRPSQSESEHEDESHDATPEPSSSEPHDD